MSKPLANKRMPNNLRIDSATAPAEKPAAKRKCKRPIPKNLMTLNDHCLLEMFSYLKPADLANVVHVNKRLNALTEKYFLKYGLQFTPKFDFAQNGKHTKLNVAKAFLRIFGYQIVALKLPHEFLYHDEQTIHVLLSSVQKYCTNLKELTIKEFNMQGLTNEFFERLQVLTLDDCSVNREWCEMKHLNSLALNKVIFRRWPLDRDESECGSVYELSEYEYNLSDVDSDDDDIFSETDSECDSDGDYLRRHFRYTAATYLKAIPVRRFGGLKEVRLTEVNLRNDCVTQLINSNSAIKCLSIVKCINVSTNFFAAASKLKHLKEFEFKQAQVVSDQDLTYLSSMKTLHTLKFTCHKFSAIKLLNGLIDNCIGIEHLELGYGRFNNATSQIITKMPSIKILKLNKVADLNETHILNIAKGLDALEELHIQTFRKDIEISPNGIVEIVQAARKLTCLKIDLDEFKLDHQTYQAILAALQSRMEQIQQIGFLLTIYGNGSDSLVPTDVLNENWSLFSVNELNRSDAQLFDDLIAPDFSDSDDDDDYYFRFVDDDSDEDL